MSLFHFISVFVPTVIALALPLKLQSIRLKEKPYRWLLYVGCFLFFVSWYLPSPLIDGKDTAFVTHFVGGGMFTGFFWVYLYKSFNVRVSWYIEVFSLFALVSALGCTNELFELLMVKADLATIQIDETSWDILANSTGAALFYVGFVVSRLVGR